MHSPPSDPADLPAEPSSASDSPLAASIARQEAILDRQLDWIKAVDSKTPIIIGLATAMLAVTGALSPAAKDLNWGTGLLMAMGSLPLVGCLAFCAAATFPHTDGPKDSLIYFGAICKMPFNAYSAKANAQSEQGHLNDLNVQCYRNAQIATAKYAAVQKAMLWLFIATPFWLIACYLLYKG